MVIAFLYSTANDAFFRVKVLLASVLPSIISYGAPGPAPSGFLDITDSRTNRKYKIPIHRNAVEAIKFKEIRAPRDYRHPADMSERGLRLLDEGFQNTAVLASQITFVDGIEGRLLYRDLSITDLVGKKRFEDVSFLLNWGHFPSPQEREKYRKDLAAAMVPPQMVFDTINSFP